MTEEVIQCRACGAKFSAARTRCPRCRAHIAENKPDPAIQQARSRTFRRAAGGLSGAFVLLLGVLWYTGRSTTTSPPASRASSAGPAAAPAAAPAGDLEPAFIETVRVAAPAARAELEKSVTFYARAATDRPADTAARSALGRAQLQLGRSQDAIATLQAAADAAPGVVDNWTLIAQAQCMLSRWEECISSLRKARELAPGDSAVAHNLGVALHRRGSDAAAVEAFQRARTLSPELPGPHLGLAATYDKLGQPTDAVASYQEYLRLLPNAPAADKIRARIAALTGGASGS